MGKGRITKEEQAYRIGMLLRFIFIFRYATREQLLTFAQKRLNLSYQRWLIEHSLKQGFISAYHEPNLNLKVYHLTKRGVGFLSSYEAFSNYYRFDHKNTGFNTFEHQKAVVESYFLLYKQLEIKRWIPEWVLRKDGKIRPKIPDGVIVLPGETKIAIEVETWYKNKDAWGVVVAKYYREISYTMPQYSRYHAVLVIAYSEFNYEGIKERLFRISPEFCKKAFMLTNLVLLERGECFYQDEVRQLKEAIGLSRKAFSPTASTNNHEK